MPANALLQGARMMGQIGDRRLQQSIDVSDLGIEGVNNAWDLSQSGPAAQAARSILETQAARAKFESQQKAATFLKTLDAGASETLARAPEETDELIQAGDPSALFGKLRDYSTRIVEAMGNDRFAEAQSIRKEYNSLLAENSETVDTVRRAIELGGDLVGAEEKARFGGVLPAGLDARLSDIGARLSDLDSGLTPQHYVANYQTDPHTGAKLAEHSRKPERMESSDPEVRKEAYMTEALRRAVIANPGDSLAVNRQMDNFKETFHMFNGVFNEAGREGVELDPSQWLDATWEAASLVERVGMPTTAAVSVLGQMQDAYLQEDYANDPNGARQAYVEANRMALRAFGTLASAEKQAPGITQMIHDASTLPGVKVNWEAGAPAVIEGFKVIAEDRARWRQIDPSIRKDVLLVAGMQNRSLTGSPAAQQKPLQRILQWANERRAVGALVEAAGDPQQLISVASAYSDALPVEGVAAEMSDGGVALRYRQVGQRREALRQELGKLPEDVRDLSVLVNKEVPIEIRRRHFYKFTEWITQTNVTDPAEKDRIDTVRKTLGPKVVEELAVIAKAQSGTGLATTFSEQAKALVEGNKVEYDAWDVPSEVAESIERRAQESLTEVARAAEFAVWKEAMPAYIGRADPEQFEERLKDVSVTVRGEDIKVYPILKSTVAGRRHLDNIRDVLQSRGDVSQLRRIVEAPFAMASRARVKGEIGLGRLWSRATTSITGGDEPASEFADYTPIVIAAANLGLLRIQDRKGTLVLNEEFTPKRAFGGKTYDLRSETEALNTVGSVILSKLAGGREAAEADNVLRMMTMGEMQAQLTQADLEKRRLDRENPDAALRYAQKQQEEGARSGVRDPYSVFSILPGVGADILDRQIKLREQQRKEAESQSLIAKRLADVKFKEIEVRRALEKLNLDKAKIMQGHQVDLFQLALEVRKAEANGVAIPPVLRDLVLGMSGAEAAETENE